MSLSFWTSLTWSKRYQLCCPRRYWTNDLYGRDTGPFDKSCLRRRVFFDGSTWRRRKLFDQQRRSCHDHKCTGVWRGCGCGTFAACFLTLLVVRKVCRPFPQALASVRIQVGIPELSRIGCHQREGHYITSVAPSSDPNTSWTI